MLSGRYSTKRTNWRHLNEKKTKNGAFPDSEIYKYL